jgi:transposase InsO family protein
VLGQCPDHPADQRPGVAQALVVARLLGQVGEQVAQVLAGIADPVPLAGEVQQYLRDRQAQQFGVGEPGRAPDSALTGDLIVNEHIQCGQEGVEIVVHNGDRRHPPPSSPGSDTPRPTSDSLIYLPLADGSNLYLATVIDCFSRRLAGWAIAEHMRTELVADALTVARDTRGSLAGAVFHSDHGAQYTSKDFAQLCAGLGVTQSMGAVGTSADNALAESFNATLKRETLQGAHAWPDEATCRRQVFGWVNRYNTRRRHSYCGQQAPIVYEQQHTATLRLAG